MYAVDANTRAIDDSVVLITEGTSVTISCTSTGAPTPSIIWLLNGQPAPFITSDSITKEHVTIVRNFNTLTFVPSIRLGSIISTLQVVNARYPDHDGVYTCVGTNDNQMVNTSSAYITVQVLGKTE